MAEPSLNRPRRRGRWWKVLAALLVLLILVVLILPVAGAPLAKRAVVGALEKDLNAKASIDDLSFSLGGSMHLGGLELVDLKGRPVASLASADASVGVLKALSGAFDVDVLVDGLDVHVYEEEDGSWSVQHLVREKEPKAKEPEEEKERGAPIEVHGPIRLQNANVHVHAKKGDVDVTGAALSAEFHGTDAPAAVRGGAQIERGRLAFEAALPGDPAAWSRTDELAADARLAFEEALHFEDLAPALGSLPADVRSGRLSGEGSVAIAPGLKLAAEAGFALEGLEVAGPRAGAPPARIDAIRIDAKTTPGAGSDVEQTVSVTADDVLSLRIAGTLHEPGSPGARADGTLAAEADLGKVARLAEGWVAFREGLELAGKLVADGSFDAALDSSGGGALQSAGATMRARFEDLAATDPAKGPIELGELADASFDTELRYDAANASVNVPRLNLAAGPVRVEGATALSKLNATPELGETRFDLSADLDALNSTLKDLLSLGEKSLGGRVEAHLEAAAADGERLAFQGRLQTHSLALSTGAEATEYGDVTATMRGFYEAAAGRASLDELTLACQGLETRGTASLEGLGRAEPPDVAFDLTVDATPSDLPPWVREMAGATELQGEDVHLRVQGNQRGGELDVTGEAEGKSVVARVPESFDARLGSIVASFKAGGTLEDLKVSAQSELDGVELRTTPADPAKQPIEVVEQRIALDLDAAVGTKAGDLELNTLKIDSEMVRGTAQGRLEGLKTLAAAQPAAAEADASAPATASEAAASSEPAQEVHVVVRGLKGDFTYVPDRVAAALGPLLPGKLTGSSPEPCRFQFDGVLRGLDAVAIVQGLEGNVEVGLGRYQQTGLDVGGRVNVTLAKGEAKLDGALAANGGEAKVGGELVLAAGDDGLAAKDSRLTVGAQDIGATSELSPLLGYLHPAFAGLDRLQKTEIGGVIDCDIDLRYEGTLDAAALTGGWEALPKQPIQGHITFGLDQAKLVGSPLVSQLLEKLDLGTDKGFELKPVTLNVVDGRLTYEKPWEWSIGGAKTSFGGSIGLDKTLELNWSIPITAELVARNGFLKSLQGQTIDLPIRGTVTRPKLETEGLLTNLASDLVQSELKGALESLTGGGGSGTGDDPASLLKRADELWDKGEKAEAAKLYKILRDEHKLTLVYTLHKDRIKERAKYQGN